MELDDAEVGGNPPAARREVEGEHLDPVRRAVTLEGLCEESAQEDRESRLDLRVGEASTEELLRRIEELNACVDYIDWKQGFYDDVLSGKTKYYSNLIQIEE